MDYKVTTPSGDTVRYKLLDGNPTREKVKIRLLQLKYITLLKGFVHTPYIGITLVFIHELVVRA